MKKQWMFLLVTVLVFSCQNQYTLNDNASGKLEDYSTARPDSSLQNMMAPYSRLYHTTMSETVGYAGEDMEKGFPEGKLGNFFADVFYEMALKSNRFQPTDRVFSLFNNGGLRVPLQKGAITRGKVFELMPFENVLVAVQLKGNQLGALATYIRDKKGQPVSRNVRMVFRQDELVLFEINGQPIDTTAVYTVLTSDYLAAGGDNMGFFKQGTVTDLDFSVKLRDGLIDYLKHNTTKEQPLHAPVGGRIQLQ